MPSRIQISSDGWHLLCNLLKAAGYATENAKGGISLLRGFKEEFYYLQNPEARKLELRAEHEREALFEAIDLRIQRLNPKHREPAAAEVTLQWLSRLTGLNDPIIQGPNNELFAEIVDQETRRINLRLLVVGLTRLKAPERKYPDCVNEPLILREQSGELRAQKKNMSDESTSLRGHMSDSTEANPGHRSVVPDYALRDAVARCWKGKRIMVAGSYEERECISDDEKSQRENFQARCRDLGRELTKQGFQMVAGTVDVNTADFWTVFEMHKFLEEQSRRMDVPWIFPERPDQNKPLAGCPINIHELFPQFDNCIIQVRGDWFAIRAQLVPTADVVVLIRGGRGTRQTYEIAKGAGIPVVPIPHYGGEAARIFDEERHLLAQRGIDPINLNPVPPRFDVGRIATIAAKLANKARGR